MIPVLIYGTVGGPVSNAIEAGLKALGMTGKQVPAAGFNPKHRDPNRGVIIDGRVPNAETIRAAFTAARARVLVVPANAAIGTLQSGAALREFLGLTPVEGVPAPEPAALAVAAADDKKGK